VAWRGERLRHGKREIHGKIDKEGGIVTHQGGSLSSLRPATDGRRGEAGRVTEQQARRPLEQSPRRLLLPCAAKKMGAEETVSTIKVEKLWGVEHRWDEEI
jgi:hypothetical protein